MALNASPRSKLISSAPNFPGTEVTPMPRPLCRSLTLVVPLALGPKKPGTVSIIVAPVSGAHTLMGVMVNWASKVSVMPAGMPLPSVQFPAAVESPRKENDLWGVVLVAVAGSAAIVVSRGAQPSAGLNGVTPSVWCVKKGE